MQPPYSPNVVNQTVDYGGFTWKGNPGQGWTKQSATGGAPVSTGDPILDAMNVAKYQQQQQIKANQPAIQTLQGQQGSLSQQYAELLQAVLGQGTQAMNTATSGENAYLASRGLLSDAGVGNNQLSQAQQGISAQNQSAAANVGMGSAQDLNQLASAIATLQAGNLPAAQTFGANLSSNESNYLGQQYSTNAQLQAAQIAAAKPFQVGNVVFNPSTKSYIYPTGQ